MKFKNLSLLAVVLVGVTVMLASCSEFGIYLPSGRGRHGPPPHAPAHGHRHKHRSGVELIYDSGLSVYIVVGLADHYFFDGHYYRFHDSQWQTSTHISKGSWGPASRGSLPPGLRGKGKGRGRGKGRW